MRLLALFMVGILLGITGCSRPSSLPADSSLAQPGVTSPLQELPAKSPEAEQHSAFRLPKPVLSAVTRFDPNFVTWQVSDYTRAVRQDYPFSSTSQPFAVLGDFNGDGKEDAMLMGHNRTQDRDLLVLSSEKGYHVQDQDEPRPLSNPKALFWIAYDEADRPVRELGLSIYLQKVNRGEMVQSMQAPPFRTRLDAFEKTILGKSSVVTYWKDGEFKDYWTSD